MDVLEAGVKYAGGCQWCWEVSGGYLDLKVRGAKLVPVEYVLLQFSVCDQGYGGCCEQAELSAVYDLMDTQEHT